MKKAKVYLVGAGIGAADLITLRGLRCIQQADCLIYDKLMDARLLAYAPDRCEKLYVGKSAGAHSAHQEEINRLLLEKARQGGTVVRLKGGDPYVFGRGGEEALCLREAGIDFEVVPGVSSAIAGPCFAGIPATHRDAARSLHIITAHTSSGGLSDEELGRCAGYEGTLVFLMGLGQTGAIAAGLTAHGMPGETPAAVISQAGTAEQKTVTAPLCGLADAVKAAGLTAPAVIVVGNTVTLRDALNFFERRSLFGKHILVTRPADPSDGLCGALERAGASVTVSPMIRIQPRDGALRGVWPQLERYTHILFTSGSAVKIFMEELLSSGRDTRCLHRARLCAVGSMTARALAGFGLRADIVPAQPSAAGLLDALLPQLDGDCRVLLPAAAAASPLLPDGLSGICPVDKIALYDTVLPETHMTEAEFGAAGFDAVVFSSGSAAMNFDRCIGLSRLAERDITVFSIGPSTSAVLRAHGVEPVESPSAALEAFAQAIIEYYEETRA